MLTNKSRKQYNYFSRYKQTDYYYDTNDKKYTMGVSQWLNRNTPYIKYNVQKGDTYDIISLRMYNSPLYWWCITDFNRILDPFVDPEEGTILNIPIFSNIEFQGAL